MKTAIFTSTENEKRRGKDTPNILQRWSVYSGDEQRPNLHFNLYKMGVEEIIPFLQEGVLPLVRREKQLSLL